MTDLPNHVTKQQLHFMALNIVVTLKFHIEHIGLLPHEAPGCLPLARLCIII
jgi:hypothetical protein